MWVVFAVVPIYVGGESRAVLVGVGAQTLEIVCHVGDSVEHQAKLCICPFR